MSNKSKGPPITENILFDSLHNSPWSLLSLLLSLPLFILQSSWSGSNHVHRRIAPLNLRIAPAYPYYPVKCSKYAFYHSLKLEEYHPYRFVAAFRPEKLKR